MTCVLQYAFEMTSELICQSCYLAFLDCVLKLSAAATMTRCVLLPALHSLFFCFATLVLFCSWLSYSGDFCACDAESRQDEFVLQHSAGRPCVCGLDAHTSLLTLQVEAQIRALLHVLLLEFCVANTDVSCLARLAA